MENTEKITLESETQATKPLSNLAEKMRRDIEKLPPPRPKEEIEREKREEQVRERLGEWKNLQGQFGVRFQNCSLENFEASSDLQRRAVAALEDFSRNMVSESKIGYGLFMLGPCGRGKDHLMVAMLQRAVLHHGMSVLWKNGLDLFGDFRDMMRGERKERAVIEEYKIPDILALSDPITPAGELTDYHSTMLQRIVDVRYRNLRPIWVTCNASGYSDAGQKVGIPVIDRLIHNALVIKCEWGNHRKLREIVQEVKDQE